MSYRKCSGLLIAMLLGYAGQPAVAMDPSYSIEIGNSRSRTSDIALMRSVKEALHTDPELVDASKLTAKVQNGEVTLTGRVLNAEQAARAVDIAAGIKGVRKVRDRLERLEDDEDLYEDPWMDAPAEPLEAQRPGTGLEPYRSISTAQG